MFAKVADGRTDLVFDLLAEGLSADARDDGGVSLLQWCAYYGDVSAVRFLCSHGADLVDLGPNLDLNGAAFHGHWRLTQFLIEQGADPNVPLSDTGESPLHVAVCRPGPRSERVVHVLLGAGARTDAVTIPGVETGCFMRDVRTRGETPLHRAAAYSGEATIRALLEAGAQLEARDANGDSPLSWASWHRRPTYLLDLLCFGEHGVHPEAVRRSRAAAGG